MAVKVPLGKADPDHSHCSLWKPHEMDELGPIPVHKKVTSPWLHQPLNQILGEYPRWQEWSLLCQEQRVHSRTEDLIPPSSLQNTLATATKPFESSKVWEKWSFSLDCCVVLAFPELKPYPETDHTILGRLSHAGSTRKFVRFRCQLLCTKESNEESSVCSCLMGKGFLLHCCLHEGSSAFPEIFDGPEDFTMQGRRLLAFPRKVLCLSFICPAESSAWLLIKIWAALHFPFPFFFFLPPKKF